MEIIPKTLMNCKNLLYKSIISSSKVMSWICYILVRVDFIALPKNQLVSTEVIAPNKHLSYLNHVRKAIN
jgi:hypothetical protein